MSYDYKKRHDEVVRCLHLMMARRYGLTRAAKMRGYRVEPMVSNDRVRLYSDTTILSESNVAESKPDIMVHDLINNEITLVEVGVTSKAILKRTETTKSRKYEHLAEELRQMHGARVTIVPIVITWDGLVTKMAAKYLDRLHVSEHIFAYMQGVIMRNTAATVFGGSDEVEVEAAIEELERAAPTE